MNKIYKVVYNKAKNAYEVVSELGKNRSKMSGSSLVKGAVVAAIVSGAVFTGGGHQVQ
ncbi:ESPR domain-containing protein [Veillonella agrestimuris]|uniref:ESPR domain-containing protein n=1 Tax=Veillonella agrestimuris TaxID=2941340 RepID=UPI00203BDF84|nr:ESPR domain-containing protein [Veillonella agrestimuris]